MGGHWPPARIAMRPFEILILLFIAPALLWPILIRARPRWIDLLVLAAPAVALLQLVAEGYRWQMIPAYALVVLLFLFGPLLRRRSRLDGARRRIVSIGIGLLGLLALLVAVALPALLPVPRVPQPTGSYPVGTVSMHLVDRSRDELYSGNPGDPREIMLQVWYPADPLSEAQPGPWMDHIDIVGPAISTWIRMPPFFIDHVKYARTYSYPDAPLAAAQARYPVLLFSHGWGGFRQQNTYQMEELASHGYVVAAVEHTYGAVTTVFPDGRVARNNPDALPRNISEEAFAETANRLVRQWAGDLGFALDHLAGLNEFDPDGGFTDRLDLARVGALGHSTGGGAAVEFCGRDARCKAGLAMDAFLLPVSESIIEDGVAQPFLFMFSETWTIGDNAQRFERLFQGLPNTAYWMTIAGTAHYDFTDLPMFSPLASTIGLKGPLEGSRVLRIINDYTLAFFDSQFEGGSGSLLQGPSPDYPEVRFAIRRP
jgi:predicted dienelactone hydrolase